MALRMVTLLAVMGCAAPGASEMTSPLTLSSDHTVVSGTEVRQYRLFVPLTTRDDKRAVRPLVLMLHGYGGSLTFAESTGMPTKGSQEGFIVASLLGTKCDGAAAVGSCDLDGDGTGDQRGWNTSITPGTGITADDVQYVRDVIADIKTQVAVDDTRIFAAGLSQGGMMTYRLAAEMPDTLAAVGIVSGTIGLDYQCDALCTDPTTGCDYACGYNPPRTLPGCRSYRVEETRGTAPISVVIVHGSLDDHLWYNGDLGVCTPGLDAAPLHDALELWVNVDGCSANERHHFENQSFKKTRYAWCDQHTEVIQWFVKGMRHEWQVSATTGNTFSTNDALWRAFERHHL